MTKAIVSFSGGMDSTTVLAQALADGREVQTISMVYGSKHNRFENKAAEQIAYYYEVPWRLIDLTAITKHFKSDLLLSGGDIPEGHYESESMKRTVVPFRNGLFAAILAGIAVSEGAEEIWLGVHAGDRAIYPDCRPEFISWMEAAIRTGTETNIRLIAPFLHDNKEGILRKGYVLTPQVPYQMTRTCYKDQSLACGLCGACQERREAFAAIGRADPIPYE